jgi:hypothetical protein
LDQSSVTASENSPSCTALRVDIDIKPNSEPNCFNNDVKGVIPVAILSSPNFDALTIDPLSVSLDGQGIRLVGKGNIMSHEEDVNGDGLVDLVVQIEDIDGIYWEGDTVGILTATTYAGQNVFGDDTICIRP